jgi:uncharacterized glyoxalase superfamily protein PhnB
MQEAYRPKGLSSAVCYQDAKAAFRWLEKAFGFVPLFVLVDAEGNLGHSEMTYGNSVVMVGSEWSDAHKSPKSIGGKNSQSIHVQLAEGEDLDAHCERARAAGAEILMEPEMQFYGDLTYRARDPEGHIWTFSVTVKKMTPVIGIRPAASRRSRGWIERPLPRRSVRLCKADMRVRRQHVSF